MILEKDSPCPMIYFLNNYIHSFARCCESYFYFPLIEALSRTDQSGNALKIALLWTEIKNKFQKIIIGRDACMEECFSDRSSSLGTSEFNC